MSRVTIVGAGLAGSLLAIYLARRDIVVNVYEARPDMRLTDVPAGRSINLALSDRGIAALRQVGMDEYMLAEAVPMYGRMVHSEIGKTSLLPYSGRTGEYINSVSRAGLNIALMNEAEKYESVRFHFNARCVDVDCGTGGALFSTRSRVKADTLIATDGAGSSVRTAMAATTADYELSQVFLEHGYKELHIPSTSVWTGKVKPPTAARFDTAFLMEPNALHIWPRHRFMMIALPNFDGSFTCTVFLAHTGGNATGKERASTAHEEGSLPALDANASFDQLTTESGVRTFWEREFPDAIPLMPTLAEDFFHNPTGNLGTVKCWPWNVDGNILLLGDSAHAMVPFYGQGMNCAFEDVRVLDGLIERHGTDWGTVYDGYCQLRKVNTDAIQDMAEENFYEMRDAVADPVFVRKRHLETRLEQTYPDYFSKYSMVTFREDLPYSIAKERGNAQDRLLMQICASGDDIDEMDLDKVMASVRALA